MYSPWQSALTTPHQGCAEHTPQGPGLPLVPQRRGPAIARLPLAGGYRMASPPSAPAPGMQDGGASDSTARQACPSARARLRSRRTIRRPAACYVGAALVYHEIGWSVVYNYRSVHRRGRDTYDNL